MKIIAEKDRRFIDKGKVKLYNSLIGISKLDDLYSFQKIVLQPNGKEKIECKKEIEYIFIVLSGQLEIIGNAIKKEFISADFALVVSKEFKKLSFKNREETDAELLLVTVKKKSNEEPQKIQLGSYFIPLISPDKENNGTFKEQPLLVSRGFYQRTDAFVYKQKDMKNILYIYIISGEVNMNGNTLVYNDAAIFTNKDQGIMTDFRKNTELLIIEISL